MFMRLVINHFGHNMVDLTVKCIFLCNASQRHIRNAKPAPNKKQPTVITYMCRNGLEKTKKINK